MSWSPSYDGYALTSANGIAIPKWSVTPASEVKTDDLLEEGSIFDEARLSGLSGQMTFHVSGTTTTNLRDRVSALLAKLRRRDLALLKLDSTREVPALGKVGELAPPKGGEGLQAIFTWKWMALEPYWRATSESSDSEVNSSAAPTISLQNAGDAHAWPRWEIENTGVTDYIGITVTIRNGTSGEEFRLVKLDLAAGDTLYVSEAGEVYLNSGASANSRAPLRVDGQAFSIPGGNVAQTITFEHLFGTASDITFTGAFRARYQHLGVMW